MAAGVYGAAISAKIFWCALGMTEEVIINTSPHETRVALVKQGLLQEIFIERSHTRGTVGNIYQGKVVRILPGMQSAFVDIGQSRTAFMHITDLVAMAETVDGTGKAEYPPIDHVLHDAQELLVQVTKEPINAKGARVTSGISLSSRFLVYMPRTVRTGVSRLIEDEAERQRLKEILTELCQPGSTDGFIVRTAAVCASKAAIIRDAALLRAKWQCVASTSHGASQCSLVYEDLPLYLRVMRDVINPDTVKILVDSAPVYGVLARFLNDFMPETLRCLEHSNSSPPLFDTYDLEDQIEAALKPKVLLKSGGCLVIDQTEAMTTVDVNTGAFVGRRDLEDTIYRTNLEAAAAIPRQLRLRNIGGIVVIDFIDMATEEHKRQVLRILEKGKQADRVKWHITAISALGLVEMTRKRSSKSLLEVLCEPCVHCIGRGLIKTAESVCLEIFREIQRKASSLVDRECLILASQAVIDRLLDEDSACIADLSRRLKTTTRFQVEASYTQEQFDVVLLSPS